MTIAQISYNPISRDAGGSQHNQSAAETAEFLAGLTSGPTQAQQQQFMYLFVPSHTAQLLAAQQEAAQRQARMLQEGRLPTDAGVQQQPLPAGPLVSGHVVHGQTASPPVPTHSQTQAPVGTETWPAPIGPLVASQMQNRPSLGSQIASPGMPAIGGGLATSTLSPGVTQADPFEQISAGVRGVMESAVGANTARLQASPREALQPTGHGGNSLVGGAQGGMFDQLSANVLGIMGSAVNKNSSRLQTNAAQSELQRIEQAATAAQAGLDVPSTAPGGSISGPVSTISIADIMGGRGADMMGSPPTERRMPEALTLPEGVTADAPRQRANPHDVLTNSWLSARELRSAEGLVEKEIAETREKRDFPAQVLKALEDGRKELRIPETQRLLLVENMKKEGIVDVEEQNKLLAEAEQQMKDNYEKIIAEAKEAIAKTGLV